MSLKFSMKRKVVKDIHRNVVNHSFGTNGSLRDQIVELCGRGGVLFKGVFLRFLFCLEDLTCDTSGYRMISLSQDHRIQYMDKYFTH